MMVPLPGIVKPSQTQDTRYQPLLCIPAVRREGPMIRRRKTTSRHFVSAMFLCLASSGTQAGEVSGLPAHLTPTVRPDYSFFLGNDFAAADTSDDYRTEQMIASARIRDSWIAVLDHSIMTREDLADAERGRIDTMTISLGYELFSVDSGTQQTSVLAGLAIRMVGNFEGERIQNGFHRLIESDTEAIPYTDTRQTDPAAWFLAQHYQRFREATGGGFLNGWDLGYWARAGALATADGQIDGVAGLYAVASRRRWDLWLGVRRDWRSGYDADFVLRDTAAEENKAAVSLGVRFGALVLETVQRMDSSASYGQLSFISSPQTRGEATPEPVRADVQFALHMPHITFQVATRWYHRLLTGDGSRWDEAILAEVRGGQPQLGRNPALFVDTSQVSLGIEWSRRVTERIDWLRYFASAGAGWRREQLLGREALLGEESAPIDRGVLLLETGLEFDAARLSNRSRFKLRLGVTGWRPTSDAVVDVGGTTATIQEPGASLVVGWVFTYH